MGKIFYDMGLLSEAKVVSCSATDMIGQYVGQTGPKVQKLLKKAMGKVLFIDEAYRLAEGGFATEAMDELVDCLTKPKFMNKFITILAGYDKDMDRLMSINPGLTSRFPESVIFNHLEPETSLELLIKVLQDLKKRKNAPLDLSVLTPPSTELHERIIALFSAMSALDSWGNARDVKSLAKNMFGAIISTAVPPVTELLLTDNIIVDTMETVLSERSRRNEAVRSQRFPHMPQLQPAPQQQERPMPPKQNAVKTATKAPPPAQKSPPTATATKIEKEKQAPPPKVDEPPKEPEDPLDSIFNAKRDPGVSDAVWEQLDKDKHAMVAKEREFRRLHEEKIREEKRIEDLKRAEQEAADEEERRIREQARIEAEIERRRKEAELAAIEKEHEKERQTQRKLKMLGPCPMGFQWIRQSGGYRCAGGSHFLTDAMVENYTSGGSVAY